MKIQYVIPFLLLFACSSNKDEKFCDCLAAGEKLNVFSHGLLTKSPSPEDREKMKALKKEKEIQCNDYQTMDGPKMLELKNECK